MLCYHFEPACSREISSFVYSSLVMPIDDGDEGCADPSSSEVFPADDVLMNDAIIVV